MASVHISVCSLNKQSINELFSFHFIAEFRFYKLTRFLLFPKSSYCAAIALLKFSWTYIFIRFSVWSPNSDYSVLYSIDHLLYAFESDTDVALYYKGVMFHFLNVTFLLISDIVAILNILFICRSNVWLNMHSTGVACILIPKMTYNVYNLLAVKYTIFHTQVCHIPLYALIVRFFSLRKAFKCILYFLSV